MLGLHVIDGVTVWVLVNDNDGVGSFLEQRLQLVEVAAGDAPATLVRDEVEVGDRPLVSHQPRVAEDRRVDIASSIKADEEDALHLVSVQAEAEERKLFVLVQQRA